MSMYLDCVHGPGECFRGLMQEASDELLSIFSALL